MAYLPMAQAGTINKAGTGTQAGTGRQAQAGAGLPFICIRQATAAGTAAGTCRYKTTNMVLILLRY